MERRFIKGALLSAHPEVGSLRAAHRSKNRDGWGNHSMEESRRGPASRGRIIEELLHSDCWSSCCRSSGMVHAVDLMLFRQPPRSFSSCHEPANSSFTATHRSSV